MKKMRLTKLTMKAKIVSLIIILACQIGVVSTVSAHQIKKAITTILFNERTGNIEVMHRFNLHDAEHAVRTLFNPRADILNDDTTQASFADYVYDRFEMIKNNEVPITLRGIGFELDDGFFWVYQEIEMMPDITSLTIRHDSMREIWEDQLNTVNIERSNNVKTLSFTGEPQFLEVQF